MTLYAQKFAPKNEGKPNLTCAMHLQISQRLKEAFPEIVFKSDALNFSELPRDTMEEMLKDDACLAHKLKTISLLLYGAYNFAIVSQLAKDNKVADLIREETLSIITPMLIEMGVPQDKRLGERMAKLYDGIVDPVPEFIKQRQREALEAAEERDAVYR